MSTDVTIAGNLTRAPELRFTAGGHQSCTFGVAATRRYNQNGEWQEQTSFFNVVCWGQLAEHVAASAAKGDRVLIHGRLDQRSWDDKVTGDKRSTVEIVADDVALSCRWATVTSNRISRASAPEPVKA